MRHRLVLILTTMAALHSIARAETADTIYRGGPILTVNDAAPRAEAVAVKDGRFLAVGREKDVIATKGDSTRIVDVAGRALLPGFADAHDHVMMGGLQALSANMQAPPEGDVTDIA